MRPLRPNVAVEAGIRPNEAEEVVIRSLRPNVAVEAGIRL